MPDEMDPARWRRVEDLLHAALALSPAARGAFVRAESGGDDLLRDEVLSLLAAHERTGAADHLANDLAPLAARTREAASDGGVRPGRAVGHYRIVERVGGGGMGVVYKAVDTRLDRTVALKFLQPRLDGDDSAAERFRLEARTIAALEHPNICTVHEIGETDDGQLYLAMPLYDGETVQQRIARGPLPIADAVDIAAQMARALSRAHARGIIHRDIKPSNVLVTADGIVKLLDFGIAKLVDVTLTAGAGPLGTVAYMSPEQGRGERVDHRTDIWSLGVLLYEMLAGARPYTGDNALAVAWAREYSVPTPLTERRPDVPPALDAIVSKALSVPAADRYQSAQAFEDALLALGAAPAGSGDAGPAPTPRRSAPAGRGVRIAMAVMAIAVLAWAGAAILRRDAGAIERSTPATLAVLPFADQSPDGNQQYFGEGIAEELIATLARVEGLRVASRTSAFAFRDSTDVRSIGTRLGVASVVEGSVRRDGDRLRITAQLVSADDGRALWSDTYNRAAGDAFMVQQEIAAAIAQTLRARLVGPGTEAAEAARPDPAAYELYLQGRYAWYRRTEASLHEAVRLFQQAVTADSTYVRAHAGLADAYAVLGFYDYLAPNDAFPQAEASALRAVALGPFLAGPRATLGYVALYHRWDLARGEEEFQRAIALEPNYSTAHQWYANLLTAAGRFTEAERAMRRAQEIDPLSLIANAALGWVLYHAGDYAGASAQCQRTLDLDGSYALAHLWRGWALQELDSLDEAIASHRRALAVSDSSALYIASLARALARGGQRAEATRLLRVLETRQRAGRYVPAYEIARVHEALGHTDEAVAWLRRALAERAHSLVFLRVDPQLARLRGHPAFADLVRQVGAR